MAAAVEQQCRDLPDEIWLSIFSLTLNSDHLLDSLSLVCKRFLALTNHIRRTLTLLPSYPNPHILLTLLQRFSNLRSIDASRFSGDLDSILCLISGSGLPILELNISNHTRLPVESLVRFGKGIRVLKCSRIGILRGDDLVAVAEALPSIRDLDISYPENGYEEVGVVRIGRADLSDAGIEEMSVRLPDLMKINVSGNLFISDRAIGALATNCKMLTEIVAVKCCFLTPTGIAEAIRKSLNLASFSVSGIEWGCSESAIIRGSSRSLSGLHFSYSTIYDEFLCSLMDARLPLKQLSVSNCLGFSLFGISSLVSAYRSLTYLTFGRMECLTDVAMAGLAEFLPSLASVNLNSCPKVGNLTLFAIIKYCYRIEQVSMECTGLGKGWVPTGVVSLVNQSIRSLKVAGNSLPDECAVRIALACPNLEVVDLSRCKEITVTGITGILNSCRQIRHLCLNNLSIDGLMNWDECKIEVLEIEGLVGMDDDQLDMLGSRCPSLLSVNLSGCVHLSANAVIRLVRNCTKLRQIKLDSYEEMSIRDLASMVLSMVFYRRSLRKVELSNYWSSNRLVSAKLKDVLLQHGCQIVQS